MAFNFPDTPTVGQVFGNYTWDGLTWQLTGGGGGAFLPLAGGTLTGPLIGVSALMGAVDLVPPITNKLEASSNSAISLFAVGQDTAHHLEIIWNYNATPGNATAQISTWGGASPLLLDASTLYLNATAGGPVRAGTSQSLIATVPFLRNYISGLTIATAGGTNVVIFASGLAADSTNVDMLVSAGSTRNIANWNLGAGGLLDTGAAAVNTWYHFYVIKRPDTGVVDFCMSLSAVAPTLGGAIPAAYTLFRRIGAAKLNGSGFWTSFVQDGDRFEWSAVVMDVNGAVNPGTAAVTRTLSTPPGVRCLAIGTVAALLSTASAADNPAAILISDLSIPDQPPNVTGALSFINYAGASQVGGIYSCMTNTASQVRSRLAQSTANTSLYMGTHGWIDRRGQDG